MTPARLEIGARLHFGLVDLGLATRRMFGGCGVALDEPRSVILWMPSERSELLLEDSAGLDSRTRATILRAIERLSSASRPVYGRLVIQDAPLQHVGLGVTTSLVLGALHLVNQTENLGFSEARIEQLSGRGGASGVGLSAFFQGGFVIDAGHSRCDRTEFIPSGCIDATARPLRVARWAFPLDWSIKLLLPPGRRWHGVEELEFFRAHTPVPNDEILEVLGIMYHSIVPSIIQEDLSELRLGLDVLNRTGFKRREVASHGPTVRDVLDRLGSMGIPAGMSSMGPVVYAIGPRDLLAEGGIQAAMAEGVADLGVTHVRNGGPTLVGA